MKDTPTVRFRALSQEIERLVAMGYKMKEVYEAHNETLKMSYRHFTNLVNATKVRDKHARKGKKTRPAVSLPLPQPKRKLTEDEDHGRREFRERVEGIKMPDAWREELSKLGTRR